MTYAAAGVDLDARAALVSRLAQLARQTQGPAVLAGVGPFSSLFRLAGYQDPVLAASVDGVGTKLKVAALLEHYASAGQDLVNHCVNDLLCSGATPLFFLDYIGSSNLRDAAKEQLVQGMVGACRVAGCALVGGETADMPELYAPGDFDLVGFMVGVVEREIIIDGSGIVAGDQLVGLPSSGLHTNGYSLVRRVLRLDPGKDPAEQRARLFRNYPGLGVTLGEVLLTPHRSYLSEVRPLLPRLKGIAHITGGGLPGNLPRVLPAGLGARLRRRSWQVQPIFEFIQREGGIAEEEMYRVFNMGLGMVLAVAREEAEGVARAIPGAAVVGEVAPVTGAQRVVVE